MPQSREVKLCRFLSGDEPRARTGIFHEGSIYEIDGERAIGNHRPEEVTLLAPIAHAPTLRLFPAERLIEGGGTGSGRGRPMLVFGNPVCITGPEVAIRRPAVTTELGFEPHIAAVIGASGTDIEPKEAESFILGFSIMNVWVDVGALRAEREAGMAPGKSQDFAISMGPFLVTPEELDGKIGRGGLDLNVKALVNAKVAASTNASERAWAFPELLAEASRGARVVEGDILATSAAALVAPKTLLEPGDEVTVVVERLGALMNTVALDGHHL